MVAEVGDLSTEGDPTLASVTADDLFLAKFGLGSESIEKPVLETRPATSPHAQEAGQVSEEVWEYSSEATPEGTVEGSLTVRMIEGQMEGTAEEEEGWTGNPETHFQAL